MDTVQSGAIDGVEQGENALQQAQAVQENILGAVTEIGGDVAAQGEKAKARWGAATGKIMALQAAAKGQITDMGTAAQAKMAQNAAEKAGLSAEEIAGKIVPDLGGLVASLPGKSMKAIAQTGEFIEGQNAEVEAGHAQGLADEEARIAAKKTALPVAGGRRRRRRRKSRKKRRKSRRKSRRNRKKSRKRRRRR
jgi:hypothetical protein